MIYLDHQATTPVDPRVLERMLPFFNERFANASSAHAFGRSVAGAVSTAREEVAALLSASPEEILFTSGATEACNLAILGTVAAHAQRGRHVITQATEHRAVLDTCEAVARQGGRVTVLGVDTDGRVDPAAVRRAINEDTVLVSIMALNNEIGTAQPVTEIGEICREREIAFHVDAAQATGAWPLDVRTLTADLISLSAHKAYGPKGVGALYVRRHPRRARLLPREYGGGQEQALRPGTLNVPGIVGMGAACAIAAAELTLDSERLRRLRDRLYAALLRETRRLHLNGHPAARHPGNLHLSFDGIETRELLPLLADAVTVSLGSACASHSLEPSHVLRALGLSEEHLHGSLRLSVGRFTTDKEVDDAAALVSRAVAELRARNPAYLT